MAKAKSSLFIYDRREVIVLGLLAVVGTAFAFTLGVHFGKRINAPVVGQDIRSVAPAGTSEDPVPNRQEFVEQAKGVPQASDEALNQALHSEVIRTGVKLDSPRQVDLPESPKAHEAGATTLKHTAPRHAEFTLQVGSHASQEDAQKQLDSLTGAGEKATMKPTDLGAKGRWYRVYVGGFASKDKAQQAGILLKSKHLIESFVVARPTL